MMSLELFSLGTGFAVGLAVSTLFFVGLAIGMRAALSSNTPAVWLLLSFLIRSALLLAVVMYLIKTREPLIAVTGFVLAFFIVRLIAVRLARRDVHKHKEQNAPCN